MAAVCSTLYKLIRSEHCSRCSHKPLFFYFYFIFIFFLVPTAVPSERYPVAVGVVLRYPVVVGA